MSVRVSGASDDLIEIDGDLVEEFGSGDPGELHYVAMSTGLLATITYIGGFWRIAVLRPGTSAFTLVQGTDSTNDYTDVLTVEGPVEWVVVGLDHVVKAKVMS